MWILKYNNLWNNVICILLIKGGNLKSLIEFCGVGYLKAKTQKNIIVKFSIMFALSSSSLCIASSSSTKRTSKSSSKRRRNEGVCFVSSPKSDWKSGLEIDSSAEKTKKSSFSSSIQNTFSSSASLIKACSLSTTSFFLFQTENAFAASANADAEELKQFLIGFWNFRTGDVTSILLYTVAPIALPYLIFSQVICSFVVYLSLRRSRYMLISLLFSSRNKSRKNRLKS